MHRRRPPCGTLLEALGTTSSLSCFSNYCADRRTGYDLIRQVVAVGFRRASAEPAVVYKVLRSLEESGSIRSEWSTQGSGPARRYYQLTEEGQALLRRRAQQLARFQIRIEQLVRDYAELTGEDLNKDLTAEETTPEAIAVR